MPFFRGRREPQRREPTHEQTPDSIEQMQTILPSLPSINQDPLTQQSALSPVDRPSEPEGVTRGFERLNFIGSDRPDSSSASVATTDDMAIDTDTTHDSNVDMATTPPRTKNHGPQRSRSVSGSRERTHVIYRIGSRKRLKSTSGSEDEGDDSYSTPATPITQQRSSSGTRIGGSHNRTTSHPVFSNFSGAFSTPNMATNTSFFGNSNNSSSAMSISNLLASTPQRPGPSSRSSDESDDDSMDQELEDKLLKFYKTEIHDAVTHDRYADAEKYIIAYLKRTNFFPLPGSSSPTTSTPSTGSPSHASHMSGVTSPTTSSPPGSSQRSIKGRKGDDEKTLTMMLYNLSYAQSAQQKWAESLSTLKLLSQQPKHNVDLEHFILDLTAVTLLNLNRLEEAKSACSKALKKRRKSTDPKVNALANDSCFLMSRILDKMAGDAEVEARFYRSLLPGDYNPPNSARGGMFVRRRISGETLKSNGIAMGEKVLVRKSSRAALQADGGIMRPVKEEPVEESGVRLPSN